MFRLARRLDREKTLYGGVGRSRFLDDGLTRTRVARDLKAVGTPVHDVHAQRANTYFPAARAFIERARAVISDLGNGCFEN